MLIETWLAFVAASTILLVIPGPTILTVVSYSVLHGGRVSIPLVSAVALGDSTALVLSLAGLGALLSVSAFWFTVVKWVGGLYLVFLGLSMLMSATSKASLVKPRAPESRWRLFINTYVITALNPKGIMFFVAFLPQFVDPAAGVNQQLWILAITFVVLATISASLYAVFAGSASSMLQSPGIQRRFRLGGGSLLTIAGIWVLLSRRAPV